VPQLFVLSGAPMFADPERFPWTIPGIPSYQTEAHIYAKHILSTKPDAKIAVLYQNDDFGKGYLNGLRDVLGPDRAGMIVKEGSYETSEPTVDSQVVTLQASGANVLIIAATPKFAAQAIRKSLDLGWAATRYLSYVSASVPAVMKPAGLEKSKGLISAPPGIDVTDPRWKDTPDVLAWKAFTDKYMSATEFVDALAAAGFGYAAVIVQVVKQCGNDLSRENIMRQAANLKEFHPPLLYPGITVNTSPTNYSPVRQLQLATFNGANWEPIGEVLSD
jgi:branched-chain amino acid transport system substrate-binding protein